MALRRRDLAVLKAAQVTLASVTLSLTLSLIPLQVCMVLDAPDNVTVPLALFGMMGVLVACLVPIVRFVSAQDDVRNGPEEGGDSPDDDRFGRGESFTAIPTIHGSMCPSAAGWDTP